MRNDSWLPDDLSLDKPNPARMYDYFLGGFHNLEIDRQAAEQALAIHPDIRLATHANRAFLRRAVTYLLAQGIDQFLDIGSGIPTVGNVHEIVHAANPTARVVYVDLDPVAVQFSQHILAGNPHALAIRGDVRQPEEILGHPEVQRMIDFQRPLGVLLIALLHFVPDEAHVTRAVRALRDTVVPGSYMALAHGTNENIPRTLVEQGERLYARSTNPAKARSRSQIEPFFVGFELVEPGLVYAPLWRPESSNDLFLDQPERSLNFAGVGRKDG